jgi:DNA-binding Xre family transcriptional regulator
MEDEMRLADYLDSLSWSQTDLAREADISSSTIARALKSETISRRNANAICLALSRGLKRPIVLSDVSELHITGLKRPRKAKAPQ